MSVTYESGQTEEFYFYGTDVEADAQLEIYHKAGAVKVGREQTFMSEQNKYPAGWSDIFCCESREP